MDRRNSLKNAEIGVGSAMLSMTAGQLPGTREEAMAREMTTERRCRIVVFGVDGLRIDFAQLLREAGAPALSALNPPICSLSGDFSMTKPGWAAIWSAMKDKKNRNLLFVNETTPCFSIVSRQIGKKWKRLSMA